ncbi:MAG: methyltransferase domain-containing protein [Calditrichaeota bacterium]|nr:MAG: methyltransferase domain-containing protein [Calditrichota bacterium]MBL1207532.1 methyltransferase domain-containing protein [Calditrichota bacterium]NOG47364.1 methyltransferase domain-containing protein [Calditrichota bacterium]
MDKSIKYDEGWANRLIKIYSTPDVIKQREIVLSTLNLQPNSRVLDIGSGPGLLIEDIAKKVNQKGLICGIEISDPFIALSQKRCSYLSQVEIREGDATSIPYKNEEFDFAVSTQVYEYINDIEKCLKELYRILKLGGHATIVCTDWDTLIWNTNNQDRMQKILTTFETHCADPRLPRKMVHRLQNVGFNISNLDVYTIVNPEYDENTYSHGIIDFIVSYVSGKNGISPEEAKLWANELRQNGDNNTYFFSINRYIFVVTKPV